MTNRRRPGLLARFAGLLRGRFASWLRDREERSPRAVYEQAIDARRKQYREIKQAVAGVLYMRARIEHELSERRAELARTIEDLRRAVAHDEDESALALMARRDQLQNELEHAQRELDELRNEAEEAKGNLVRFREEIRGLEREKGRALAALANAAARRRVQETLAGLSVDADLRALEHVREHVARLRNEVGLEREIGEASGLGERLRAIRDEAREDAARRELEAMKRALRPLPLPAQHAAV